MKLVSLLVNIKTMDTKIHISCSGVLEQESKNEAQTERTVF